MKLAIIVDDNAVYIDGIMRGYEPSLDLKQCNIPSNIHALQWNDSNGWIEYVQNSDGSKPLNLAITILPNWANLCVEVYNSWKSTKPISPISTTDTTNS